MCRTIQKWTEKCKFHTKEDLNLKYIYLSRNINNLIKKGN